jgi:hypothetical protein
MGILQAVKEPMLLVIQIISIIFFAFPYACPVFKTCYAYVDIFVVCVCVCVLHVFVERVVQFGLYM